MSGRREEKPRQDSLHDLSKLVPLAKKGDLEAEYRVHEAFKPLLRRLRRQYYLTRDSQDAWESETYLLVHRLIMEYDPARGADFLSFLLRTLPPDVWSWVRQRQKETVREMPIGGLRRPCRDNEPGSEIDPLEATQESRQPTWSQYGQEASVEETAVLRLTVAQALDQLAPRRREIFARAHSGQTCREIAAVRGNIKECVNSRIDRSAGI